MHKQKDIERGDEMARLWKPMSHDLAYLACEKAFAGKWSRDDVLQHIEEWTGYSRKELILDEARRGGPGFGIKYPILEECAMSLEDMVDGILHGVDPDFDPVLVRERADGATGKIRKIAYLCIRHQLLGHLVKLGMEPLLNARILPTQHASLPGRGQTRLKRQVQRFLNRKLGIKAWQKTDCTSAYASVMYPMLLRIIHQDIPRAEWIMKCLWALWRYSPDGHLIIGGYLDTWLFNYVMSYGMRYVLSLQASRRGNKYPLIIRAVSFMDDLLLMGRSITAVRDAVRELVGFYRTRLRMMMRTTTEIIKAGRGFIDMAGYRIYPKQCTIRRRNWKRIRRCMIRAWREIEETGTIKRQRVGAIIARYGMLVNSDSLTVCRKYHVFEIMRTARKVMGYWNRVDARKRKEQINNAVRGYGVYGAA